MSSYEKLKQEHQNLRTLKEEFDSELKAGNLNRTRELRIEMEKGRDALAEKLWPFKELPQQEFKEQYESQKEIMERVGILEKLSTGEMGIKGIDNKEYVFPAYQEIVKRMKENKEILKTKTEQGFNQLLIVPFGMKLDDLIEKYKQVILKHHKEGKLLATKEKSTDPDEKLELNEEEPVWTWGKYKNADLNEELVYFPKEFSENHQGLTKKELLEGKVPSGFPASRNLSGGWNILLIEDLSNIPRENKGKTIKGRKQLEAGKTPNKYLDLIKTDPQYQNETGMTPEEQIIYAIKHLEQTNQVIDDYSGKGSASYQLGAYFSSGGVPRVYWLRDRRRVSLGGGGPGDSGSYSGFRPAVRIGKLRI